MWTPPEHVQHGRTSSPPIHILVTAFFPLALCQKVGPSVWLETGVPKLTGRDWRRAENGELACIPRVLTGILTKDFGIMWYMELVD
jgi:hypothetical protein